MWELRDWMVMNVLLCRDVTIDCVFWSYFSAVFLVKHKQTHMRFALKKMNKQLMPHRNQVQCWNSETPPHLSGKQLFPREKMERASSAVLLIFFLIFAWIFSQGATSICGKRHIDFCGESLCCWNVVQLWDQEAFVHGDGVCRRRRLCFALEEQRSSTHGSC